MEQTAPKVADSPKNRGNHAMMMCAVLIVCVVVGIDSHLHDAGIATLAEGAPTTVWILLAASLHTRPNIILLHKKIVSKGCQFN